LRNIHLNPTLPTALPDFKLVDPMLEMFCKLASRHVITYANSNPGDGQKLEMSGIIIELMRMRDFCFALRDRAKAALDVAMIRTGYPDGATEVSSSHEFIQNTHEEIMRHQANIAKMFTPPSNTSNEKSRADFVQTFETTYAKPIQVINEHPAQANASLTHAISADPVPLVLAAEVQHFNEQNGNDSHINFESSVESIISYPVNDSQESTVQEETGLWNWWDMIEMDLDNNMQVA
jgi:hypothetical protein